MRKMQSVTKSGFTLIELVMTLTLMSIISVVLSYMLVQGYRLFNTAESINNIQWNGFISLERLFNDIHRIRSSGDMTTITATQLSFNDVTGASLQYTYSGNTLTRNNLVVATNLSSFAMSYFDNNGNATSSPSAVRYIRINATVTDSNMSQSLTSIFGTRGMS